MPSNFSTVNVKPEDKIEIDKILFIMSNDNPKVDLHDVIGELIKLFKKERKKEYESLEDSLQCSVLNSMYRKHIHEFQLKNGIKK